MFIKMSRIPRTVDHTINPLQEVLYKYAKLRDKGGVA